MKREPRRGIFIFQFDHYKDFVTKYAKYFNDTDLLLEEMAHTMRAYLRGSKVYLVKEMPDKFTDHAVYGDLRLEFAGVLERHKQKYPHSLVQATSDVFDSIIERRIKYPRSYNSTTLC